MDYFLSDSEIEALIREEKKVSYGVNDFFKLKQKKGHKEHELTIARTDGSMFKIIIRVSAENPLDFSAILGFVPSNRTDVFLLRRYNGKSHEHSNRIENEEPFYDFHIHTATEKYQREGPRAEYYAQVTDRYSDIHGAVNCLIQDCNVVLGNKQITIPFT